MKIETFVRKRGVTKCRDGAAGGLGYSKPTATDYGTPESFLHRESAVKCSECRLAQAKILTMFEDLGGKARATAAERLKLQNDAYHWFFNPRNRQDFEAWCDTAGYDPQYVRDQAKKVHAGGIPQLRAAAGMGERYQERKQYRDAIKLRSWKPQ